MFALQVAWCDLGFEVIGIPTGDQIFLVGCRDSCPNAKGVAGRLEAGVDADFKRERGAVEETALQGAEVFPSLIVGLGEEGQADPDYCHENRIAFRDGHQKR